MATATKLFVPDRSNKPDRNRQQPDPLSKKDRLVAIAVLILIIALFTLMVWLASLGNGGTVDDMDYWHMMP